MARVIIQLSSQSRDTVDLSITSKFAIGGLISQQHNMAVLLQRVGRNIETYKVLLAQPSLTAQQRRIIATKLNQTAEAQEAAEQALIKLNSVSHIAELRPEYYKT